MAPMRHWPWRAGLPAAMFCGRGRTHDSTLQPCDRRGPHRGGARRLRRPWRLVRPGRRAAAAAAQLAAACGRLGAKESPGRSGARDRCSRSAGRSRLTGFAASRARRSCRDLGRSWRRRPASCSAARGVAVVRRNRDRRSAGPRHLAGPCRTFDSARRTSCRRRGHPSGEETARLAGLAGRCRPGPRAAGPLRPRKGGRGRPPAFASTAFRTKMCPARRGRG